MLPKEVIGVQLQIDKMERKINKLGVVNIPRPGVSAYNVKAYGAVGDGVTNDTPKIQAAIAAATPSKGTVYIPHGTYLLSTVLVGATGVDIVGAGPHATILHVTATNADGLNPATNSRIADLTLRGPNTLASGFSGIDSGGTSHITIANCIIEKWGDHGINTGGWSSYWRIINCIIQDNKNDGVLLAAGTTNCVIANNFILSNGSNGIDINGSYNIAEGNQVLTNGSRLAGTGADGFGILVQALSTYTEDANYNIVRGNIVKDSTMQGIIVRSDTGETANYNVIANNYVEGMAGSDANGDGIALDGTVAGTIEGNSIVGNIVRACLRDGISLNAATAAITRSVVSSNIVTGCTGRGIVVLATDTLLHGNICMGNNGVELSDLSPTSTVQDANKSETSYTNIRQLVIANNGVARLLTAAGSGNETVGMVLVVNQSLGFMALYTTQGGLLATQEMSDPSTKYTPTAGTANMTNIYWSAGNARFEIENKTTVSCTYSIFEFVGKS